MGLKTFHIVFIAASLALSVWFGVWGLQEGGPLYVGMGIASFVGTLALLFYSKWFFEKLRGIGYLAIALPLLLTPDLVSACAVCVGDPTSPLVKSSNIGIAFLLSVISSVLAGFGGLFLYWGRRERDLNSPSVSL